MTNEPPLQGEDLSLGVEDVLMMAWTERREKQEAKKVLSQLQENYDVLQRKFADAENRIDKLRYRIPLHIMEVPLQAIRMALKNLNSFNQMFNAAKRYHNIQ